MIPLLTLPSHLFFTHLSTPLFAKAKWNAGKGGKPKNPPTHNIRNLKHPEESTPEGKKMLKQMISVYDGNHNVDPGPAPDYILKDLEETAKEYSRQSMYMLRRQERHYKHVINAQQIALRAIPDGPLQLHARYIDSEHFPQNLWLPDKTPVLSLEEYNQIEKSKQDAEAQRLADLAADDSEDELYF